MFKLLVSILTIFIISGCYNAPKPDMSKTKTYNYEGVNFEYPSNWNVNSDKQYTKARITIVSAPSYANTMLYYASEKLNSSLEDFASNLEKQHRSSAEKGTTISKGLYTKLKDEDGYEVIKSEYYSKDSHIKMDFTRIYKYKIIQGVHCYIVNHAPTRDTKNEEVAYTLISSTLKFVE